MEVKSFKGLRLFGVTYQLIANGNGTYRVADASGNSNVTVANPDYTDKTTFKLSDIKVSVTNSPDSNTSPNVAGKPNVDAQTVSVQLPEAAVPLVCDTVDLGTKLDSRGHQVVLNHTSNRDSEKPLRLFYTVGVVDAVKRDDPNHAGQVLNEVDLSKLSDSYLGEHTAKDGSVEFLSNLYSHQHNGGSGCGCTTGDATAEFSPSHENAFYYFQGNSVIYSEGTEGMVGAGGSVSKPVTGKLDTGKTYYFVTEYYGPKADGSKGTELLDRVVARSGRELEGSVDYIDAPAKGAYLTAKPVKEYGDPASGRVLATKVGGVRLGSLDTFAHAKEKDDDTTAGAAKTKAAAPAMSLLALAGTDGTATDAAADGAGTATDGTPATATDGATEDNPSGTASGSFVPTYTDDPGINDQHFRVYLGNNGRLTVEDTAVQVSKVVEKVDGLTYKNEPTFSYTARFEGLGGRTIRAVPYELSNGQWVPVADAQPQTFTADSDGNVSFSLENGQALRFVALPNDVNYTVTENEQVTGVDAGMADKLGEKDPDGFFSYTSVTGSGTANDGDRAISSTTAEGTVSRADFTNTFSKSTELTAPPVSIYKELQGRDFDPDDSFTFVLTPGEDSEGGDASKTPMPAGSTTDSKGITSFAKTLGPKIAGTKTGDDPLTYRSNDPVLLIGDGDDASSITYDRPGTYTYLVNEERPSGSSSVAGIAYDGTTYRLTVKVGAQDNALKATLDSVEKRGGSTWSSVWKADEGTDPTLTFTNSYNTQEITVAIEGRKVLDNATLTDGQFSFTLRALGAVPADNAAVASLLADGALGTDQGKGAAVAGLAKVGQWEDPAKASQPMPAEAGGAYELKAKNGASGGVSFGEIAYDRALAQGAGGNRGIVYKYQVTEDQPTDNGSYDGEALPAGSDASGSWAAATKIDHDGNPATPERWYYKGVVYDDSVKTFYVYVHLDDIDGGTSIHAVTLGDMPFDSDDSFANSYRSQASMTLTGTKAMEGRDFQGADDASGRPADSFTFHVDGDRVSGPSTAVPMPDKVDPAGNVTITPTGSTKADIAFGAVHFTQADAGSTYRYTVTEAQGTLGGVTYDAEPRTVEVAVSDDGHGNLSCTVADKAVTDGTVDAGAWTNSYKAQSVGASYQGSKTLVGAPLVEGAYTFDVTQVDESGNPVENGLSHETTNSTGTQVEGQPSFTGSVALLDPSWARFDEPGTYRFLATEVPADDDGTSVVTYDQHQYLLEVPVTDDTKGSLVTGDVKVSVRDGADGTWSDAKEAAFTNTYSGETYQPLILTKQFFGTSPDETDPHSFVLTVEGRGGSDPASVTLPETTEVANGTDGSIAFDPVVFSKEGTYALNVHEKQPTDDGTFSGNALSGARMVDTDGDGTADSWHKDGMTYDPHVATSLVSVTRDQHTGRLVTSLAGAPTSRTFSNDAGLVIEKKVQGDVDDADRDTVFYFDVTATTPATDGAPAAPVTGDFEVETDDDAGTVTTVTFDQGTARVGVKAGHHVRIVNLPHDVRYSVTEVPVDGWSTVTPASGTFTGTLAPNTSAWHTFVNAKNTPDAATVSVGGQKIVTSAEGVPAYTMKGGEFSFSIAPAQTNPDDDPVAATTVSNDRWGQVSLISAVAYPHEGTYRYTVREEPSDGAATGIIYDSSQYTVTVKVVKGDGGKLAARVSYERDGELADGIVFTNTFDPTKTSVMFAGVKTLDGSRQRGGEFEFDLVPLSAHNLGEPAGIRADGTDEPAAADPDARDKGDEVKAADAAKADAAKADSKAADKADASGPADDTAAGPDEADAQGAKGSAVNEAPAASDGTGAPVAEAASDPAAADPQDKGDNDAAQGADDAEDAGSDDAAVPLSCTADDTAPSVPVPTSTAATNQADGGFRFGTVTFDRPGTYQYLVVEKDLGQSGVTYDGNRYHVTVTVTDHTRPATDAKGGRAQEHYLTCSYETRTVGSDGSVRDVVKAPSFVNLYDPPHLTIAKSQKVNDGPVTTDPQKVQSGDTVTYYLTVANDSETDATDVAVDDPVPNGLVYKDGSASDGGAFSDGTVAWSLGTLAAGASRTVSFACTVPTITAPTSWTNVAGLTYGNNPDGPDKRVPSNEVTISGEPPAVVPPKNPPTKTNQVLSEVVPQSMADVVATGDEGAVPAAAAAVAAGIMAVAIAVLWRRWRA